MNLKEIVIDDELEAMARTFRDRNHWSETQLALIDRYYGRVPVTKLRDKVGHSIDAIHKKAAEMGIPRHREALQ